MTKNYYFVEGLKNKEKKRNKERKKKKEQEEGTEGGREGGRAAARRAREDKVLWLNMVRGSEVDSLLFLNHYFFSFKDFEDHLIALFLWYLRALVHSEQDPLRCHSEKKEWFL